MEGSIDGLDPLGFSFVNGMSNDSNYINGDNNAFCERVDNEAMCIIKEMINAGLLQ